MDNRDHAPIPGCGCTVCVWANRRIDRERRLAEDLEVNYQRYEAGLLVSKDETE